MVADEGRDLLRRLADEAVADSMVPKGYIEVRDGDGKLLRRQWIGTDDDLGPGVDE